MDKGKLKWRSRRGLRELDLLFRNFIEKNWDDITDIELEQYAAIVNLEDQPLFDYIFKDISLGNAELELFIDQRIKPYLN
ncbi:MAG: succinate dehydrogenase assembly factor 2 [Gammaproteobacteria bacterium]|mgnify:CR=1 FL=1|jgi:antitoxin CptB